MSDISTNPSTMNTVPKALYLINYVYPNTCA